MEWACSSPFGASDGNPNPVKYAYNVGATAWSRGAPRTPSESEWARTQLSGDFVPFLRQSLGLGPQLEDAVGRCTSNAAITPWGLNMALDLQIVDLGPQQGLK